MPRAATAFAVVAFQFLPLVYGWHAQRPHPRGVQAEQELRDLIRSYPGPVLMLYHGFYGWSAGKGSSLHQIALDDVLRARGNSLLARDPHYFDRMFDKLRHGPHRPMIITDTDLEHSGFESRPLWASLAGGYRRVRDLGWLSGQLDPINGNHWSPRHVYVPVDSTSAPPHAVAPDSAGTSGSPTGAPPPRPELAGDPGTP
jgi:hypothetical protein